MSLRYQDRPGGYAGHRPGSRAARHPSELHLLDGFPECG